MKHIASFSIQVVAELDDDAGVWVATSDDVPGLVAEHEDLRKLMDMVAELIPVLIIENGMLPEIKQAKEVPVHIAAHALGRRSALIPA